MKSMLFSSNIPCTTKPLPSPSALGRMDARVRLFSRAASSQSGNAGHTHNANHSKQLSNATEVDPCFLVSHQLYNSLSVAKPI